jgi:hypothetical protein
VDPSANKPPESKRDPRGRPSVPNAARELAVRLRNEGLSLRKIATRLAGAGFRPPSAAVYHPQSIAWMLQK